MAWRVTGLGLGLNPGWSHHSDPAKDWEHSTKYRATDNGWMDGWIGEGGMNRGSLTSLTLSIETVLCSEAQLLYRPGNQDHHHGDDGC